MLLSYAAQAREPQAVFVVCNRRWSDQSARSANKSELLWHKPCGRTRRRWGTNLVIGSWSMTPADEASKDIRYRFRSGGSADRCKFPVLRFLGNDRVCMARSCPLSSSLVVLSVPGESDGHQSWRLQIGITLQTYGCLGGRHVSEAYL